MKNNLIKKVMIVIAVTSLLISFLFSNIPHEKFLPDFLCISSENKEMFSIIYDISIGVLVSFIFLIFIQTIPNYVNKKNINSKLINHFNNSLTSIEILLLGVMKLYDINENIHSINKNTFVKINGTNDKSDLNLSYTISYNSSKEINEICDDNINSLLLKCKSSLDHLTSKVSLEYSLSNVVDNDLIKILVELSNSRLFSMYINTSNFKPFVFNNTSDILFELYQNYLKLKKMKITTKKNLVQFK